MNAVAPGPIWTPIQVSGGATVGEYTNLGGDRLLKRPGQPAEMAPIYVGFAEEANSYATGQVHAASGGNGET